MTRRMNRGGEERLEGDLHPAMVEYDTRCRLAKREEGGMEGGKMKRWKKKEEKNKANYYCTLGLFARESRALFDSIQTEGWMDGKPKWATNQRGTTAFCFRCQLTHDITLSSLLKIIVLYVHVSNIPPTLLLHCWAACL